MLLTCPPRLSGTTLIRFLKDCALRLKERRSLAWVKFPMLACMHPSVCSAMLERGPVKTICIGLRNKRTPMRSAATTPGNARNPKFFGVRVVAPFVPLGHEMSGRARTIWPCAHVTAAVKTSAGADHHPRARRRALADTHGDGRAGANYRVVSPESTSIWKGQG